MSAADIRRRIQERMDALETNMQQVAIDAGLKRAFLQEFMKGRKATMRPDAMEKIAKVLGVSVFWLTTGLEEPDDAPASAEDWAVGALISVRALDLASVGAAKTLELTLDSLNLNSGESVARGEGSHSMMCRIVDPALLVSESVYARALASRRKIRCLTKVAKTTDGKSILFVLNTTD